MKAAFRRVLLITSISCVLVGTASCGTDDSDSASVTSAARISPTTGVSSDGLADESRDPSGGNESVGGCNAPRIAVESALEGNSDVLKIENDGSCGVDVTTSLTGLPGESAKALAICETASAAAYANGGNSVQIYSPDTDELSISVKGAGCIAEP